MRRWDDVGIGDTVHLSPRYPCRVLARCFDMKSKLWFLKLQREGFVWRIAWASSKRVQIIQKRTTTT